MSLLSAISNNTYNFAILFMVLQENCIEIGNRNHEGSLAHEYKILVRRGYWLPVILPTTSSLLNYPYSLYSMCHTSTYDSSAFKIEYLKKNISC